MTTIATKYDVIIGLEVHAQLLTQSKMFCRCNADYADSPPNSHVCPVCLGLPGSLPVANRRAVEYTIMTGLALNCRIPEHGKFDRKNYPYPDLMKGYQISQYDQPLCKDGWLLIEGEDGSERRIGVTRVHLEEDTARLLHRDDPTGEGYSLVDVNRSGVPLMEIVSEPDIRSPEEARRYLVKLRQILRYLGVSAGNMEEGNFRVDANISVRPAGQEAYGVKVEVKNMNSFRSVARALEYEARRQVELLESGGRVVQETRGWVEAQGRTVSQRSKEYAHDYRYFPDPDLPPLVTSREWVEEVRSRLPELPDAKRRRFTEQYGLSAYEADLLTETRARADYFEAALAGAGEGEAQRRRAKAAANWILGDFAHLLSEAGLEIEQSRIPPGHLAAMLDLIDRGAISTKIGKTVLEEMFHTGKTPQQIVEEKGLAQISGADELAAVVDEVLAANEKAVADYRSGKAEALKFLVGQVMKATRGRANPQLVNDLLAQKLGAP
ncbi:MAG TPA: Asp-tRNA(Asn)/Glu-tRNA(Gln) amidotransferase subunit GatB [Dehalococcoidia bacterium]